MPSSISLQERSELKEAIGTILRLGERERAKDFRFALGIISASANNEDMRGSTAN